MNVEDDQRLNIAIDNNQHIFITIDLTGKVKFKALLVVVLRLFRCTVANSSLTSNW